MDKIAVERWILVDGNSHEATGGERKARNTRLLAEIDSRWELGRTENADTSKRPLLNYQEWGAVEMSLYREVRVRDAMGEQWNEGSVPRWGNWNQKEVESQWRWLKELSFYPRRRPV